MPFLQGIFSLKAYGAVRADDAREFGATLGPVIGFFELSPFGLSAAISQGRKLLAEEEGIRGEGGDGI